MTIPNNGVEHSNQTFMQHQSNWLASYIHNGSMVVRGIEIFGSTARKEATINSDFDLIVLVDEHAAKFWMQQVNSRLWDESLDTYSTLKAKLIRFTEAVRLLGLNVVDMVCVTGIDPIRIDLFVFPTNWKDRLTMLQQVGHHHDPRFMSKIARDARPFVPGTGFDFEKEQTSTTLYRVVSITTQGFIDPMVEENTRWYGSDIDKLSRRFPPSDIWGADELGRSEIEDGFIRFDTRFERQTPDGSWEKCDDPRRRITPMTDLEREIDAENRDRYRGDYI